MPDSLSHDDELLQQRLAAVFPDGHLSPWILEAVASQGYSPLDYAGLVDPNKPAAADPVNADLRSRLALIGDLTPRDEVLIQWVAGLVAHAATRAAVTVLTARDRKQTLPSVDDWNG